jgi:Tfp pilus assembly protein PilV
MWPRRLLTGNSKNLTLSDARAAGLGPRLRGNLMQQNIPRQRRGFTLLEVMIAATVLILAIVGMIQVVVSGSEMLDFSRKQTIAMQIIHDRIERLHLVDWTTVSGSYASPATQSVAISSTFAAVASGFTCSRTVTSIKADGTLYKITFTVTWTGNTGHVYTRSGTTYFGKNGLYVTYQRS